MYITITEGYVHGMTKPGKSQKHAATRLTQEQKRQLAEQQKVPQKTFLPDRLYTVHPGVQKVLVPENGSYKTVVDPETLYELAKTYASIESMATVLGVDPNVLRDPDNDAVIQQARANAELGLRASQFKAATEDRNPTMLIWLGKQLLQQKDIVRNEQTGPDGKPIELAVGPSVVAVLPPNGRDLDQSRRLPPPPVVAGPVSADDRTS